MAISFRQYSDSIPVSPFFSIRLGRPGVRFFSPLATT